MRLVTRGLGGGQSCGLVLAGMTQIERIFRGGGSVAKDIVKNLIDEFTIAAKLIEVNGKELFNPIFIRRKYMIDESKKINVRANKKNINKKSSESINVIAKILDIKRGRDGNN